MKKWNLLLALTLTTASGQLFANEFTPMSDFGDNPGELKASYYQAKKDASPLVVMLHGCGQNGELLAKQSGFLAQAKQHEFSLLIPQQVKSNNATGCFNWFSKGDQAQGQGETQSIVNMIDKAQKATSATATYIVGLSAGGAMASSLMALYPQEFKAGAVIAGVPYPCADNLIKAISCMKSGTDMTAKQLAKSIHQSNVTWPQVTVITGEEDKIVNPANSELMAQQWGYLTGQPNATKVSEKGITKLTFGNGSELITIAGMGHGLPVNPKISGGGHAAPFVLESPFSAADYLVNKWISQ